MLADASILRNFAVVNWIDILIQLAGGIVYVAHGVMSLDPDEPSEIDSIRASFHNESLRHPGSPESTAATAALVGLDDLLTRDQHEISVVAPTAEEFSLAVRLQDPAERAWRESLGVTARRLDAGESVSIAIATARGLPFATDDDDGRAAYLALGGADHYWTLDLAKRAVEQGLVDEPTARSVYDDLRNRYRFWGVSWD